MISTALEKAMQLCRDFKLPALVRGSIMDPDWVTKVMAFHDFYNVPMLPLGHKDRKFRHMSAERVALRIGFQVEELGEAFENGLGIEMTPMYAVHLGDGNTYRTHDLLDAIKKAEEHGKLRDGKEVADAAADSTYFWIGFLLEMGYDLRTAMTEVHASNMTKPDEEGNPIYREDGKVLKGPNYMEPNLVVALGLED